MFENKSITKRAVIYCRVSTREQVDEGSSLITQEKVCREYATKNGFEVAQVFLEQGESAKTADRTELQKLLVYCSDKKQGIGAVIVYKLDRLSRNTDDYSQLRLLLKRYGVEIRSTSEFFENTPAGRFMENIIANVAQFDNDVRAERCAGGMKDAMREGRFVWMAPVGYENAKVGGKPNIRQNPVMAPLIKQAFESVAKGFYDIDEVRKKMNEAGLKGYKGKPISKSYFYRLLKNRVYLGYIEKFGESHKGLFEPIIDEELFNQVQRVLKNKGRKIAAYKADNPDFPLRRFVEHPSGRKLTGSWSKGRSGTKYPFYRFGMKGSNYRRDDFEKEYMAFMDSYAFDEEKIEKLKQTVREKFGKATENERNEAHRLRLRQQELVEQQNVLVQKNLKGIINDVVLKQQLDLIDKEADEIYAALTAYNENEINVEEAVAFAEEYLRSPSSVWKKALLPSKLKLQRFQFPRGVSFDGKIFGTTETALVFQLKDWLSSNQSSVVDQWGFEPQTFALQRRCSTN